MQVQLTQKERMLLEDMKSEEELCIMKYQSYAQQAKDSALQQMFNQLAGAEQKHFDTISQILQGNQPNIGQGQGSQTGQGGQTGGQTGQSKQPANQINLSQAQNVNNNNSDKFLLQDMLSTEKYVSGAYDTSIFECSNPNIRQALQHIQKEEQQHGEQLFQYMNSHGMYQLQ